MNRRLPGMLALFLIASSAYADTTITVFAAASLKESFADLGRRFQRIHPGTKVVFQFAGSQQLATQIHEGAKADVFASADERQMVAATGQRGEEFAKNRLVIVVSKPFSNKVKAVADLALPGLKLAVGVHDVPVGFYAEEALRDVSKHKDSSWASKLAANIVTRETDVRAILTKVELGEADAGIVYATDAKSARGAVTTRAFPEADNVGVSYRIIALAGVAEGGRFVKFALGPEGRRVLSGYGFMLP